MTTFNLTQEPWLKTTGDNLCSLMDVFSDLTISDLSGTSVEKIAQLKLLLAIAQAASTPATDEEWAALTLDKLATRCRDYLQKHQSGFDLYGEAPFLQSPVIASAEKRDLRCLDLYARSENYKIVTQDDVPREYGDADIALNLVCVGCFSPMLKGVSGPDQDFLFPGQDATNLTRRKNGFPGPAIGYSGYMHTFWKGSALLETVRLNLMTSADISVLPEFPAGIGSPPWEKMPEAPFDGTAKELRDSLMGRLVPLGRFALLCEEGIRMVEGVFPRPAEERGCDPSCFILISKKGAPYIPPCTVEKKPWRELVGLMEFFKDKGGVGTALMRSSISRIRDNVEVCGLWSGGISVKNQSGGHSFSAASDHIDSTTYIAPAMAGTEAFERLSAALKHLEALARKVRNSVKKYHADNCPDGSKHPGKRDKKSEEDFWVFCDEMQQEFYDVFLSDWSEDRESQFWKKVIGGGHGVYERNTAPSNARQLIAAVKNRPYLGPPKKGRAK